MRHSIRMISIPVVVIIIVVIVDDGSMVIAVTASMIVVVIRTVNTNGDNSECCKVWRIKTVIVWRNIRNIYR